MRDRVEALLKGAFDFRIHTGPEPDGERRTDFLEAGRDAYEAEMAGFVLMKHRHPTALAAYALNRMYPGFHAVGSIVLNYLHRRPEPRRGRGLRQARREGRVDADAGRRNDQTP